MSFNWMFSNGLLAVISAIIIGLSDAQNSSSANSTVFQEDWVPSTQNISTVNNLHVSESLAPGHVLVVKSKTGDPCLLASLNATIQISYKVLEGIVHERYVSTEDIQLTEDVSAQGVCGSTTSKLLLNWGNGTFHLNLTFSLQNSSSKTDNASWALTDISVRYDLSNMAVFPGSSESGMVVTEKSDLSLFVAEIGHTHLCSHDVIVQTGSEDEGVMVSFHSVKLAAFGVRSSDFPDATDVCVKKDDSDDPEDLLVPLIVACSLSAIVIVIVVGYVISRKIQTRKEQTEYSQM